MLTFARLFLYHCPSDGNLSPPGSSFEFLTESSCPFVSDCSSHLVRDELVSPGSRGALLTFRSLSLPHPQVIVICWGIATCGLAASTNFGGLLGCRFLLGSSSVLVFSSSPPFPVSLDLTEFSPLLDRLSGLFEASCLPLFTVSRSFREDEEGSGVLAFEASSCRLPFSTSRSSFLSPSFLFRSSLQLGTDDQSSVSVPISFRTSPIQNADRR